jgi:hypothetical protein
MTLGKRIILIGGIVLCTMGMCAQQAKLGRWIDTTADMNTDNGVYFVGGHGKLLVTEEYEVIRTHEICAGLYAYHLDKSGLNHFDVTFKGMRTSAQFSFSDQLSAEKWAEKWCTPESLLSITAGRGTMKRAY